MCLIQVSLFLNLRIFDVISHFLPNLFVTGIILDYLHLVSENPRPLLFLGKKNLLGGDIHSHPHLKPLYSQSFLQIYIYDINYNKSFAFTSCRGRYSNANSVLLSRFLCFVTVKFLYRIIVSSVL